MLASFLVSPEAGAGGFDKWRITSESFFDYARAEGYWAELRTREQLDAAWAPCETGPYSAFRKEFRYRDKEEVEPEFAESPDADGIRACYDLQQTYFVYENVVDKCRKRILVENGSAKAYNIFTRSCEDVPDWRSKK